MKKIILLVLIAFAFSNKANCQITKGNWLIGGNANFSMQDQKLNNSDYTSRYFNIDPDIGYLISDKFAAGIRGSLYHSSDKAPNTQKSKATLLGLGPFVRYYFLPTDNRVNFLADAGYQYSTDFKKNHHNDFKFSTGPVIFFNSSVGLELTINYDILNNEIATAKTFSFAVGFQIHFKNEK
jgi:hypothetical protein